LLGFDGYPIKSYNDLINALEDDLLWTIEKFLKWDNIMKILNSTFTSCISKSNDPKYLMNSNPFPFAMWSTKLLIILLIVQSSFSSPSYIQR
jgi:hypothetical protein